MLIANGRNDIVHASGKNVNTNALCPFIVDLFALHSLAACFSANCIKVARYHS